jgi:RNA polymerase sigma-70 factor (ECF subfamily)
MIYQAVFDEDLLSADPDSLKLRRGDPAALAAAVHRYQHRLYRYFLRLVHEPALVDDLFQQTWLNVLRRIHGYDPSRSFDTWLFAIAHNAAIDALRKRPGEDIEECAIPSPAADALSRAIERERSAILAEAARALPAVYREALTLRFEEGMKLEEIAEVTGVPLSTAKSRVQRAIEGMRALLRPEDVL